MDLEISKVNFSVLANSVLKRVGVETVKTQSSQKFKFNFAFLVFATRTTIFCSERTFGGLEIMPEVNPKESFG